MRYRDQVLACHKVTHTRYELSGLRTGSIRDQMLRAHLITSRLANEANIIRPGESNGLLIVGGGAAGVCAALTAANAGVDATIAEIRPDGNLFINQAVVNTRRIDPIEFDWPQPYAQVAASLPGVWPRHGVSLPLPMEIASAADLAMSWADTLDDWLADNDNRKNGCGLITVIPGVDGTKLKFKDRRPRLHVTNWPDGNDRSFSAVLSCIGSSGEEVSIRDAAGADTFVGHRFWQDDPFCEPHAGISRAGRAITALVSGGGDGAMQDYLRLQTGKFGRELWELICKCSGDPPQLSHEHTAKLLAADEEARRAHAWRSGQHRPTGTLQRWHTAYKAVAKEIIDSWNSSTRGRLRADVLRQDVHATLLFRESEPDFCYGLNRLLTLLVLEIARLEYNRPIESTAGWNPASKKLELLITKHEIAAVSCSNMAVNLLDPDGHHLEEKEVWLVPARTPKARRAGIQVRLGSFDIVVIRHGARTQPMFGWGAPIPEQLMPFDLPN